MGAKLPGPHRCFSIRNPLARALLLAVVMLTLGAILLRSDMDVRSAILKTAASAKEAISSQRPLGSQGSGWRGRFGSSATQDGSETEDVSNHSMAMTCDYDMERLRKWQQRYKLEEKFEYTKRYVQLSRQDISRKSVTQLEQNLLVDAAKLVDVNKEYKPVTCPKPLEVPVTRSPFPSTANASDFMFGVSTTYKRFTDTRTSPINEWTYWLTDSQGRSNGGKLVLLLLDAADHELKNAYDKLSKVGIDVDVYRADPALIMAVRYLALAPKLYNHPERKNKKWLVICDDDTFFPSFHALAGRFAEYDHERAMYIGTFSEDVNNIRRHGSQAFGGAGVFLSVPTAKLIAENFDSCRGEDKIQQSNTGWGSQGDILLRKCIYENSAVKLTLLPDLWQLDMFGDPSGFYESGIKPLSLHHYRGGVWHIAHPWHYTKVAHVCGEDCTMQRFQTADDFVISNGFSIAHYPKGIDFDLGQFEATFHAAPENTGWNMDFRLGPQRESLHKTGKKISWDLQDAVVNDDGSVSQVYVCKKDDWRWKNPDGTPMSPRDGIVELVWLPEREGGLNGI
ncbi:glycosyltransferase family 31 protein [Trichocladium antarcticum]|uniref:Glycosyltransferase family 31 protein n=1 Tax=Trichocladium antarcticum TaxID=1450529 RepID=A0AAN6UG54_9PEZI|nr:glycosyltransferase family 31 protein [Trichocladium antarcticum]